MLHRPPRLIGRAAELSVLRAAVDRAREGAGGVVVVEGPPGQGKSSLLAALAAEATGVHVLPVAGSQSETGLPFAALDALARPLLEHLPALPGPQAAALERALAIRPGGAVERYAVAAATLSLLAAASASEPLLCLVDDVQWLDESSRAALFFAARRLRTEPIALVLAGRGEPAAPDSIGEVARVRLSPLSDADSIALVDALTDHRIAPESAERLARAGAGNPLALRELVRRLPAEVRDGRAAMTGPPPPDASARALLSERAAALPANARRALLITAVAGDSAPHELRRALAGAGLSTHDLLAAESAGMLRLAPDGPVLQHPLVWSVAYHDAAPAARRAAHRAVADAMAPFDHRRPWHLAAAAAEPDETVASALDRIADDAETRSAFASAARARHRAADLSPDPPARCRRLLAAAAAFEVAGAFREAELVLEQAERHADDPRTRARLRGMQAHQRLRSGHPAEARDDLLAAARSSRATDPAPAAGLFLEASFASMLLGDVDGWRSHAESSLACAPDRAGSVRRAALSIHAAALIAAGRADEASAAIHEIEADLDGGPAGAVAVTGAVEAYGLLVHALVWIERFDSAGRLLERLIGDARRAGAAAALPFLLGQRAVFWLRLGRWSEATAALDEAVTLAEDTGQHAYLTGSLGLRALFNALRGDAEEARATADRGLAVGEIAAPRLAIWPRWALGLLALGRGDIAAALTHLQHAARVHDAAGFAEPGSRPWQPDLIEALTRAGQLEAAERALADWTRQGDEHGRVFAQATAARCRGILAGDDEIDAAFTKALQRHAELPMPYDRARTLLAYGQRLRRARRRSDARPPLRDALRVFSDLGAADWAALARSELRACGGAVPVSARPRTAELTAHEMQVALMVAQGGSNREVGASLFLSPKTIEHHLSTIFRKLGIKRRTELARALGADLPGESSMPSLVEP